MNITRNRTRGFSLAELAISITMLGVGALMVLQAGRSDSDQEIRLRSNLERVEDALYAYAHLHGRLPCPALDLRGEEQCEDANEGKLPFRTLGLPLASAAHLSYRIPSSESWTPTPGFQVLQGGYKGPQADFVVSPTALDTLIVDQGGVRALNLCHVLMQKIPGAEWAYVLEQRDANTGGGEAPIFRRVASRTELAARLQCGATTAAARSYFHAALSASMMERVLVDNLEQYAITYDLNKLDLLQGSWFYASTLFSITTASLAVVTAVAKLYASMMLEPAPIVRTAAAVLTVPLLFAHGGALLSNVIRFSLNLADASVYYAKYQMIRAQSGLITDDVQRRARESASKIYPGG